MRVDLEIQMEKMRIEKEKNKCSGNEIIDIDLIIWNDI